MHKTGSQLHHIIYTDILKLLSLALTWYFLFFSDCLSGLYCLTCNKICSEVCIHKNCERTAGTCTNGCSGGYVGRHCDQG